MKSSSLRKIKWFSKQEIAIEVAEYVRIHNYGLYIIVSIIKKTHCKNYLVSIWKMNFNDDQG